MPVLIDIDYTVTDADDDQVTQVAEFSTDDITYNPMTFVPGDGLHVFSATLNSGTTAAGVIQHIVHDAEADLGEAFQGTLYIKITLDDASGPVEFKTNLVVDLNDEPFVLNVTPVRRPDGSALITYRCVDAESAALDLTTCEWSTDPSFVSPAGASLTAITGDPLHDGITGLTSGPTSGTGVDHKFVWDARADLTIPFSGIIYIRKNVTDPLASTGTAAIGSFNYVTRGTATTAAGAAGRSGTPSSRKPLAARSRRVRSRSRTLRRNF